MYLILFLKQICQFIQRIFKINRINKQIYYYLKYSLKYSYPSVLTFSDLSLLNFAL